MKPSKEHKKGLTRAAFAAGLRHASQAALVSYHRLFCNSATSPGDRDALIEAIARAIYEPSTPRPLPIVNADPKRKAPRKYNTTPAEMRVNAATQSRRRPSPATHPYVIGCFVLQEHGVRLYALDQPPAYQQPEALTSIAARFARWRSRQAAHQWMASRQLKYSNLRPINLDLLDVLAGPVGKLSTELTGCQQI